MVPQVRISPLDTGTTLIHDIFLTSVNLFKVKQSFERERWLQHVIPGTHGLMSESYLLTLHFVKGG